MKKYLLLLLAPICVLIATNASLAQVTPYLGPTSYSGTTVNYVRTWVATAPGQTPSGIETGPVSDVKQTTEYFDAFGRPQQTIVKQASPLGNDMVSAYLYNSLGQEQYRFLPFASTSAQTGDVTNNGTFKSDAFLQQQVCYDNQLQAQQNELFPSGKYGNPIGPLGDYNWTYQVTDYEASPLNRKLDIYPPGVSWAGTQGNTPAHNVQYQSLINTSADNVQTWSIAAAQGSIPMIGAPYSAGTLYKTVTIDEQGNQVITYKDTYGQEILTKVQNSATPGAAHSGWLCTYKVYDDYGHLRFIIPPAVVSQIDGTWVISQAVADELCYRFEYDALDRMVIKKAPGTPTGSGGEVWMVYDVRNRLVMQQDGNLRAGLAGQSGLSQWLCFIYDALDRKVLTGTINSASSLATMQAQVTSQTGTNSSGTLSGATPTSLQGNLTLPLPSMSGTWQATESITLTPGFSTATGGTFTAQIVSQSPTAVNNTLIVNNNPVPSGLTLNPLIAMFYDNYNWQSTTGASLSVLLNTSNINGTNFNTNYNSSPYPAPIVQSNQVQGLPTGAMKFVLGSSNQNLYSLNIYDEKGNAIQTQCTNISGGTDVTTDQYDFSGKKIRSLLAHVKSGTNPQTHLVSTAWNYDAMGRLLNISKSVSSTIGGTPVSTPVTTVVTKHYDELGRQQQVTLGNSLETQQYEYNVRGWLLGMNRSFAETPGTGSNYFGYAVGYDNSNINAGSSGIGGFATPTFIGNAAGEVWKSKGDNQIREYDFTYDQSRRLAGADFNQFDGTQFDKTAGIDYSVSNMSYDGNGNIGSMNQNGWIIGGSQQIDQLVYNYLSGSGKSNRLQYVADNSPYNGSNPASTLGDFHYAGTKTSTTNDYSYDDNANATSDANRSVSGIVYSLLNLPQTINFANSKGSISFLYDAAGNKLQKTTVENSATVTYNGTGYSTSITTTTRYIAGFVYKSVSYGNVALASLQYTDNLQYLNQEEGRVRALYANASSPTTQTGYAFDYFIRDNVNNVRMVLTDEQWQDTYPAATLEPSSIGSEQTFYSITNDASHVIDMATNSSTSAWWPSVTGNSYINSNPPTANPGDPNSGQSSTQMYRLNGQSGDRYGLGITLKVMAGDQVSILGKSVWHNSGITPSSFPVSAVLANLLTAFAGTNPVATTHPGITGASLDNASATSGPLTNLLNNAPAQPNPTVAPKAAINWVLFNDQFVPISMGSDLVSSTGDVVKAHSQLNLPMATNGYLYVYCSNESNIDVFFDNLQVVQTRGPILEEDHYYPIGLRMAGISDHAWNKLINLALYQSKEMQDQEFSDGTGLAEYDFAARFYDQQLGRWQTQDPAAQFASPYLAMANSWPNGIDPTGTSWFTNWFTNMFWAPLNEVKIVAGLFAYNKHQTVGGNILDFFSRLTWQAPQEVVGLDIALNETALGLTNRVSYFDGATVINTDYLANDVRVSPSINSYETSSAAAFTLGNFINGPSGMKANPSDPTFQHEYGRYLQSQADGFTYLTFTAIPDAFHPGNDGPTARDANARAIVYFNKYYGTPTSPNPTGTAPTGGFTWHWESNTINNYVPTSSFSQNYNAIQANMRNPGVADYIIGYFWPVTAPVEAVYDWITKQ